MRCYVFVEDLIPVQKLYHNVLHQEHRYPPRAMDAAMQYHRDISYAERGIPGRKSVECHSSVASCDARVKPLNGASPRERLDRALRNDENEVS